jgi:hypothetical protein
VIRDERHRSRVRRLFLATVVFVLAQIAMKEVYPGLHAPGFGDPGRVEDLADRPEPRAVEVWVRLRGGGEQAFRLLDLLPRTHYKQRHLVARALVRALASARDPSAREWLRREVGARHPGRAAERIEVRAVPRSGSKLPELLYSDEPGGAA